MKANKLVLSALTIFSLSAAACSGGDGEKDKGSVADSGAAGIDSGATGGGGSSSGVDGSKALTDLDDAERKAFCDYVPSLVSKADFKKLTCVLSSIYVSESEGQCQMAYDVCFADPDITVPTFDCPLEESAPECAATITVAELEVCAQDQGALVASLASSLSCATTKTELSELESLPPSCQALKTKCPELELF